MFDAAYTHLHSLIRDIRPSIPTPHATADPTNTNQSSGGVPQSGHPRFCIVGMFSKNVAILALCTLPAFSAPSPLIKVRRAEEPVAGRYIVTLKDGVNREAHVRARSTTHEWDIINGFAGTFSEAEVEDLRSNPDVAFIEEDGLVRTQAIVTQ